MRAVSCGDHCHPFDFDFRALVEERGNLDQDHGGKMFSHVFAITFADSSHLLAILVYVRHVDHQSDGMPGLTAAGFQYCHYIRKRLVELLDKVLADNLLLFVPGDLSGDEQQFACVCEYTM